MTTETRNKTQVIADMSAMFADAVRDYTVTQAQHLIENFHLMRSVADGGLEGAVIRLPGGLAKAPTSVAASAKPITPAQFSSLQRRMVENRLYEDATGATRIGQRIDLVHAIADGAFDDVLITRDVTTVTIDHATSVDERHDHAKLKRGEPHLRHLDDVYMFRSTQKGKTLSTLVLVGFPKGADTIDGAIARLAAFGLSPATRDHGIAFAAAHPAEQWQAEGVKAVLLPASTARLHDSPICAMLSAPDVGNRDRNVWSLGHHWCKKEGWQFDPGPGWKSWTLAVMEEHAI